MPRRSTFTRLFTAAIAAGAIMASALIATPAYAATVTHTIAQVQGTPAQQGAGGASPLAGQVVTVEGIMIGDHRTGGYRGFYLQTPGPKTANASDGIFVFVSNTAVTGIAIGERVQHRHADHRLGPGCRRTRPGRRQRDHPDRAARDRARHRA